MDKHPTRMKMKESMLDNGKMVQKKEKELKLGQLDISMRENLVKVNGMGKEL